MLKISRYGILALAALVPLCAGAKSEASWTGMVTAMNTDSHTVSAETWWRTLRFYVGNDCAISTPEKANAALKDIRAGEKVTVSYRKQGSLRIADRIQVHSLYTTATVLAIDAKDRLLTLDEGLKHSTFHLAKKCRVILSNDKPGTLADLGLGSRVSVAYDSPGVPPIAYRIREGPQTTAYIP
jgi:hypothetical protein